MALTFQEEECATSMPFPEKVAWFTLVSAVVTYGAFVSAVLITPAAEQSVLRVVVLFTIALTVQGVTIATVRPILALRDPQEARFPLDERDRTVAHRAFKMAYLTLMAGIVILAMGVPYVEADWQLTLAAYLTAIVADMVRMAATIGSYRRRYA
jgi:hypothetical protein